MSQQGKNVRLRRTQKLLRQALVELIDERGFDAITIGELTSRAMVSRAAFYRTYRDKYDLVEQIFEEAISALLAAVGDFGREHPPEIWVKFFEHIAEYEPLYRALLGRKGSPWFVWKMRAALADLVKQHEHVPVEAYGAAWPALTFSDDFVPDVLSAMLVEAITWWLERGRPSTPKQIAMRCALLASAIFREVGRSEATGEF